MQLQEVVHRVGHSEGVRLTAHVADTYVAPDISKFDNAEIPDMSTTQNESLNWISNYTLNSVLHGAAPSPEREYRFNFLARAMTAYGEHFLARHATLAFLESEEQSFGKYFTAIHHWEQFLAAAWNALDTLRRAGIVGRLYERGDGSIAERLDGLYNQMKRVESRMETGKMPPQGSLAVWLCNSGLRSIDRELAFAETGEILANIRDWAHVVEDPLRGPSLQLGTRRSTGTEAIARAVRTVLWRFSR
jgi:hypothetical protein